MTVRVPYAEAAKALLRDTLLTAAGDLLRERPWPELTMADVAKAAGVSRQTLYKEFGSRQGFAQVYILRETDHFLRDVEAAITTNVENPRAAIAAAFQVFLTAAAEEPLIKAIVAGDDSDGLLELVTNHAGPVLAMATERLSAFLAETWPAANPDALRTVAELLVRLAVSYAASPAKAVIETADAVADIFGPHVEGLIQH
ncbi:TetR/AcrR family transcriptional regulator [Alloactinosynnema sp. L-07]|uniref:TetR/AcrR family transcriptional regulator n=1 Tax=Alloactinosynnema sp. L-07 TaxID=1653480 RepID=UPI0006B4B333|nr:TetR family transcriptional regulator [Alloactinosynnema sp. L-07]